MADSERTTIIAVIEACFGSRLAADRDLMAAGLAIVMKLIGIGRLCSWKWVTAELWIDAGTTFLRTMLVGTEGVRWFEPG